MDIVKSRVICDIQMKIRTNLKPKVQQKNELMQQCQTHSTPNAICIDAVQLSLLLHKKTVEC